MHFQHNLLFDGFPKINREQNTTVASTVPMFEAGHLLPSPLLSATGPWVSATSRHIAISLRWGWGHAVSAAAGGRSTHHAAYMHRRRRYRKHVRDYMGRLKAFGSWENHLAQTNSIC